MKKIINYTVTTFIYKNVWRIDIVNNKSTYEAWLYHKDYGIKTLMFGAEASYHDSLAEFIEVVEVNADDYIKIYKEEYVDEFRYAEL